MDLLHTLTLGDVLREHRRSYPRQTALVCQDARFTYPEMDDRVNRLANALVSSGFASGQRIPWLGQNCHRGLQGLLDAANTRGVFCPVNWRQSAHVLTFLLEFDHPPTSPAREQQTGTRRQ